MTLDGHDLRTLNLGQYRRSLVGYVSQEPVLFNCSIRDNLRYAKPDATEQECEAALRSANAWDFVSALGGMGISVGNAGGQLSGGQK